MKRKDFMKGMVAGALAMLAPVVVEEEEEFQLATIYPSTVHYDFPAPSNYMPPYTIKQSYSVLGGDWRGYYGS